MKLLAFLILLPLAAIGATSPGTNIAVSALPIATNWTHGRFLLNEPNGTNWFTKTVPWTNAFSALSSYATNYATTNVVWRDIVSNPTILSKGGTATTRPLLRPLSIITVDGWKVGSYGDGECQFNHDMANTNPAAGFPDLYINPHCHLSVTNIPSNTSNAVFTLNWNWTVINGIFTNSLQGTNTVTNTFAAAFKHDLLSFGYITNNAAAGTVSSIFTYRLERGTATGDVGDTTGITRLHDFDIHYPIDRPGSSTPDAY